jgi:outer membrane scaffolding protein for murein synthesis (MipA/OmpV family)
MNAKLYSSLAAAAALLVSPCVGAQDQIQLDAPEEVNFVGLGVFGVPDYYGSSVYNAAVAPLIRYSWDGTRYVQLLGSELTLNLVDVKQWRAGPLLRYRGRRDDDVDDNVVRLMRPVATATELGVFGSYHMPLDPNRPLHKLVFTADVVGNTNNVYEGATGNVRVNYIHPFEQLVIGRPVIGSIGIGMFFASSSFNRRYFGVTGSDVGLFPSLAGREYRPDGGVTSLKIPFSLTTQLNKEWLVTFAGRYERLLDEAKDSPVVRRRGEADQWQFGIAAAYRF